MNKKCFSQNLKELMAENKFSQQDVATKIGVSQRAVSKWLRKESEPTASSLYKLAVLFNTTANFLIGLSDN